MLAPLKTDATNVKDPASGGWHAALSLQFEPDGQRSVLRYRHVGPLRIQKALYPEGPGCCHAIVVHPPGGIAAGDSLTIDANVAEGCAAVVSTPAAAKWYGAHAGGVACQRVNIDLKGQLEWLPAETIVFDRARVDSTIDVFAGDEASMIGWDLLVFGRVASHERFLQGQFDQRLTIHLGGEPIWVDRLRLSGGDALFDSPIGLGGHHALSTFWAVLPVGTAWSDDRMEALRDDAPGLAFTRLDDRLLVGRQVAHPIELQDQLHMAWRSVKQRIWGRPVADLRLWAT